LVLVVGVGLNAWRFSRASALLPARLVGRVPLVGDASLSAPYLLTAREIRRADAMSARYRLLGRALDPERDVLVWTLGNGGEWYRHGTFALPAFTADLLWGDEIAMVARKGRWSAPGLPRVEVPRGGRAVFVFPSSTGIPARGVPVARVPGLQTVAFDPGPTPLGIDVVAVENPFDPATGLSRWP
jgi:hypothetical protein